MATKSLKKIIQHQAYQVVLLQLSGVVLLAFAALVIGGPLCGFSVFAGGAAYVLPNLIFVWRVFRYVGAGEMGRFVTAFFLGEMLKLILSAFLFLLVEKYLPVSLLSELIGFVGAIISFWIACMWFFSRQNISKGVASD